MTMAQDPQYVLTDANGNALGGVFIDSNGHTVLFNSNGGNVVTARTDGGATIAGQANLSGGASLGAAVAMSGNYLDGKAGHWSGYLSTTMTDVTAGANANFAENVSISDGTYTKDSSSQVTVNRAGDYRLSYTAQFRQTGSDNRQIMAACWQVNGVQQNDQTESSCYIRNAMSGDENAVSAGPILSLASGDSLTLYVWEKRGGQTTDLVKCHAHLEYLG